MEESRARPCFCSSRKRVLRRRNCERHNCSPLCFFNYASFINERRERNARGPSRNFYEMASVLGGGVIACLWTPPTQPPPKNEGVRNFPRVCSRYFDNLPFSYLYHFGFFLQGNFISVIGSVRKFDVPDQVRIKSIVANCMYAYVQ